MHKLTDTEYQPELAHGYSWRYDMEEHSSNIHIHVIKNRSVQGRSAAYSNFITVDSNDDVDSVRKKMIDKMNYIATLLRPWNPTHNDMVTGVFDSLKPPVDDEFSDDMMIKVPH